MIKKIIKKLFPPIITDILRIIYKFFQKNKISSVKDYKSIDSDSITLKRKSFGMLNPDKEFYVITGFSAGMFSTLQYVLAHIHIAEAFGMIPVVDFENFWTVYTSYKSLNGTKNTWLWFFKSISPYSLEEVYSSKNVFFGNGEYNWNMGHYFSDHNFFNIYSKYIVLQSEIVKQIDEYKNTLNFKRGERILGIQFRGWEQNVTASHPFGPTVKQMFSCTNEIMKKYNIDRIYLATEQQEYHDAYIKRYGEKVIFTPYFMTKKGINAYKIKPEPRANHLYHCGIEIIINAFLLAECTGILHCGTNVSTFAKFLNNGKYEFEYIIFNGVNSSNPFLAKYMYGIRKNLPKVLGGLKNEVRIKTKEL